MSVILESSNSFPEKQRILIDTNVLYWLTYANSRVFPRTLKPQEYQLQDYPRIFGELLNKENTLYYSNYSISELASIIARVEASLDGCGTDFQRKKWLREKGRKIVLEELHVVTDTIESWADALDAHPPLNTAQYVERYGQVYLDGYDIYIENEISKNGIEFILTDDIDFTSVEVLNVITANRRVPKKLLI